MDLANNFLDGTIPNSLGFLSALTELTVNDNLLSGGVPDTLASLNNLGK